ncbi:MAG: DUF2397 family protein [Comamonadaceae bacterium]|nr:DUF2397 family protein [Comamonadaceae bacterium]
MPTAPNAADLFRHIGAERGTRYRAILEVFAAAKRQFRLHMRPDEVLAEADWRGSARRGVEEVQAALAQLSEWGNLESQPDTARGQHWRLLSRPLPVPPVARRRGRRGRPWPPSPRRWAAAPSCSRWRWKISPAA